MLFVQCLGKGVPNLLLELNSPANPTNLQKNVHLIQISFYLFSSNPSLKSYGKHYYRQNYDFHQNIHFVSEYVYVTENMRDPEKTLQAWRNNIGGRQITTEAVL